MHLYITIPLNVLFILFYVLIFFYSVFHFRKLYEILPFVRSMTTLNEDNKQNNRFVLNSFECSNKPLFKNMSLFFWLHWDYMEIGPETCPLFCVLFFPFHSFKTTQIVRFVFISLIFPHTKKYASPTSTRNFNIFMQFLPLFCGKSLLS